MLPLVPVYSHVVAMNEVDTLEIQSQPFMNLLDLGQIISFLNFSTVKDADSNLPGRFENRITR